MYVDLLGVGPPWVRVRNEGIKSPIHLSFFHFEFMRVGEEKREEERRAWSEGGRARRRRRSLE